MSTSGGGVVRVTRTTLNAAAIGTLNTVPTQLVAAPGLNKAIGVLDVILEWVPAVDGILIGGGISAYYGSVATNRQATVDTNGTTPFMPGTQPAAQFTNLLPFQPSSVSANAQLRTLVANTALVLGMNSADPVRAGPIVTTTLNAAGAGYAVNDTGTIDTDAYTGGAAYKVLTLGAAGAVATYQITAAGDGYTTIDNPLMTTAGGGQPGVGTGFKVNVTAISPADGNLYATTVYEIISLH